MMKYVKETPKDWDRWMKKVGITQNYIFMNTPGKKYHWLLYMVRKECGGKRRKTQQDGKMS